MSVPGANVSFPTTRWSLVLRARSAEDPAAAVALEELCRLYWYPIYAFARRAGHDPENAADVTQEFFARLLGQGLIDRANPSKGRLRSFLLGCFKRFLSEKSRRRIRQKRGGGREIVSLDQAQAEAWFGAEPAQEAAPEMAFDRHWANALLAQAFTELERESLQRGRGEQFQRLKDFLAWDAPDISVADAARDLRLSPGAVRLAIHRLRLAFRRKLQEQVAHTVASPDEVHEEMRYLLDVLNIAGPVP